MKILIYYIEILLSTLRLKLGFNYSKDCIPIGYYCYKIDEEKSKSRPLSEGYEIQLCPYYRKTKNGDNCGCVYIGFWGYDSCLWDQCKICGENVD